MPILASDVIAAAYREINVLPIGEPLPNDLAAHGLDKLQRWTDLCNANKEVIFTTAFTPYTLQANHGPHTIGPTGDFIVTARPVEIYSAAFILNSGSSNPVDAPISIRDDDWWAANPLKSLVSSIVTDLYYDPQIPNGNLNFWPICNISNPVRLQTRSSLVAPLAVNTAMVFAPGYWQYTVLSLARELTAGFPNLQPSPWLETRWREAQRIIVRNNDDPPRIDTNSGMPGSGHTGRPDFNFLTGLRN